jgi:hypothetical protein
VASGRDALSAPAWPPRPASWEKFRAWAGERRIALGGGHCIRAWRELAAKLGHPSVICCLGNGPSSEDPILRNQNFDVLFRVNYQWQARGILLNPALIFTADPDLPPADSRAILVFPTRAVANRILLDHCRKGRSPKTGYFVFPEMDSALNARVWPAQPTNGALMIAAAVALAPGRIVIAGIDLYDHPAGKYPGMPEEPNVYEDIHSRDIDVAFIRQALSGFRGETVILSEPLRRALEKSDAAARAQPSHR